MTESDRQNIENPLRAAARMASLAGRAYRDDAELADLFTEIETQVDQALWCLSNTDVA